MLGLTFADKADYEKIRENDVISVKGLADFKPGVPFTILLEHSDGSSESFMANHTYNEAQIEWFKAGSALNLIRKQVGN
jgi:aconitate hydratase